MRLAVHIRAKKNQFWRIFGVWRRSGPQNRSRPGGFVFAESESPIAFGFLGSQKGPSARIPMGNSVRLGSRPGGIFGPPWNRGSEKRCFFRARKCEKYFRRPVCCDDGAPRGARFRFPRGLLGSPGRALGPFWGPGGATVLPQKRKVMILEDFWCFCAKIAPCRWGKLFGNANPPLLDVFWGPKRGPRRGYQWGIRIAPDRARAGFLGHRRTAIAKNDVFSRAKKCENKSPRLKLALRGPLGAAFFTKRIRGPAERAPPWDRFGVPERPPCSRKNEK